MRFLADENFDNRILLGVLRENADFNVIRVQDTDVYEADDPTVLAWAAKENLILLTRDVNTLIDFAYDRIRAGLRMPGVIAIRQQVPLGQAIEELLLVVGASDASEWENRVMFLPL